ncbi:MAG: hypothetical protein H7296_03705 [Bacteroidia bacterium]|nr:hypothetical protein [Bacteroidia bacterium]
MNIKIFTAIVFFSFLYACAPTRIVKPLAKGEQMMSFNFGGPLVYLGSTPMPLPLTSIAYAKGITERTTFFGSVHTTALLFGVFQTDIGICQQLYKNEEKDFGISINPVLNFAVDRWQWNTKIWPEIDLNIYKGLGKKYFIYGGIANWFELSKIRPHKETQSTFIFVNPHLGIVYTRDKWSYNVEFKYVMSDIKNTPNAPDYMGINNKGAVGVYLNLIRKF